MPDNKKRPDPRELCEKADITLEDLYRPLNLPLSTRIVKGEGPYNQDPDKGGIKHDSDKVRPELIPPETILELAKILTLGARKYTDWNWAKGMSWLRVYGALQRHLLAWLGGEDIDSETQELHLSHALCCLMFLHYYQFNHKGTDDRHRR